MVRKWEPDPGKKALGINNSPLQAGKGLFSALPLQYQRTSDSILITHIQQPANM
jgi:hypothetical protein